MPDVARAVPLALVLNIGACHLVLGIEDAEVDPALGSSQSEPTQIDPDAGWAAATSICERYCQTVTQTCTGQFAQYSTHATCLGVCALLPPGSPNDTSGNTVSCRLNAAGQAPLEPSYYCPAAGPGGNAVCGTNCEGLCSLVETLCSEELVDEDVTNCQSACSALADTLLYTVAPEAMLYEGKHVQCRLYHASNAAVGDTEQHCQHALGGSPCD
jgi:hypothetical protein